MRQTALATIARVDALVRHEPPDTEAALPEAPARDDLAEALAAPAADPLEQWRSYHAERDAARKRARADLRRQEREHTEAVMTKAECDAAWNEWADRKIAAALEQRSSFSEFERDVIGMTLAEERKKMRAELAEAIGQLRAELNMQRAHDKGTIIDLPALPRRRTNGAA